VKITLIMFLFGLKPPGNDDINLYGTRGGGSG
jgi:hypothetical protein